jgi:ketosteroid isomerase-like protein
MDCRRNGIIAPGHTLEIAPMQIGTTTRACAALLVALLALDGCSRSTPSSHEADDKALRDLVDRTVDAAGKRDIDTYGKYYAPKWVSALPGRPIEEITGPLKLKFPEGYAIKMVTTNTGFSDAGDLGWAAGTYEQTAPDKSGTLAHTTGKWMSVFRKQPNGSWGAVFDTFNVDPAP